MKKPCNLKPRPVHNVMIVIAAVVLAVTLGGCMMVGPDYQPPTTDVNDSWLVSSPEISAEPAEIRAWWTFFNDPVLTALVNQAYSQNLTLRAAGLRVLQARAARGVSVGEFFPQEQALNADYSKNKISKNDLNNPPFHRFETTGISFDAAWELDFWGKFRRNINAADAALLGTIADYDDVLVSLVAEVGLVYVEIRTLERRLALARENVVIQQHSLKLAEARFRHGAVTKLDVTEARSTLANTRATVPDLESSLRDAKISLSVLLGQPANELNEELAGSYGIPLAPAEVATGVPADLLRRRPDVRSAERAAAYQSEQIGIATADLFPSIVVGGSIGYEASTADDRSLGTNNLFDNHAFIWSIGPSLSWPILNYGRIMNNRRIQDAAFQEAAVNYQHAVLQAAAEVESALHGFLKAREKLVFLAESSVNSRRSLELSRRQYLEGQTDFLRVDIAAKALSQQLDRQATAQGLVAANLISAYKALGGGWELRQGREFVPQDTIDEMTNRTDWGDILDSDYAKGSDLGFSRPQGMNDAQLSPDLQTGD
jgi:NodT family efflux transporter outer membrane factor (OMF) lipoprotein